MSLMVLLLLPCMMFAPSLHLDKPTVKGLSPIVYSMIRASSEKHGVPIDLALAVAYKESKFELQAKGRHGERGLFQLMPIHGRHEVPQHIEVAIEFLAWCVNKHGVVGGLRYYNGGRYFRDKPQTLDYAKKVLKQSKKINLQKF